MTIAMVAAIESLRFAVVAAIVPAVTLPLAVLMDLTMAIAAGMVLAAFRFMKRKAVMR